MEAMVWVEDALIEIDFVDVFRHCLLVLGRKAVSPINDGPALNS